MSDGTSVRKASVKEARVQKASVKRASTLQAARQVCSQPNLARHGKAFANEAWDHRSLRWSLFIELPLARDIGRLSLARSPCNQCAERYLIVACTVITDVPEAVGP